VKDTLNTIYFNISKSKNITIDLKYLVCTIINYNMGSYITTIDKKNLTCFSKIQIISYKMNIYSKYENFCYVSKSSFIPKEIRDKFKYLNKNDIVEVRDIIAVDVFGNLIKIKPVKYKIEKNGEFCDF
jgi:hypothetical protein